MATRQREVGRTQVTCPVWGLRATPPSSLLTRQLTEKDRNNQKESRGRKLKTQSTVEVNRTEGKVHSKKNKIQLNSIKLSLTNVA